nr:DUF3575 domain-containing protein [uncultured Marinifilum sp.]
MKNKFVLIAFIVLLGSSFANAQKTVVKAKMLSRLVRTGSFFVEHQLNNNSNLQLGLLYTGKTWDDTKIRGWGITLEYRFYLSDSPAPDGFFIAPYAPYLHFNLENEAKDKSKMNGLEAGITLGIAF